MRLRIVPLLVLPLLLSAPATLAQESGDTGLHLVLDPSTITLKAGGNATTTVRVTNEGVGPVNVVLRAQNASGNVSVHFSPSEMRLLPGQTSTSIAIVRAGAPGDLRVLIVAQEITPLASEGPSRASAWLAVRVLASDPRENATERAPAAAPPTNDSRDEARIQPDEDPAPSPPKEAPRAPPPEPAWSPLRFNASDLEIATRRGETATFSLRVQNDDARAQRANVTLRLPIGWDGTISAASIEVPGGGFLTLRGSVTPGRAASDASATLDVAGPGGVALARLVLTIAPEPAPPSHEVVAETPIVAPSPAPPKPASREPAPPPALRVVPAEIGAPPGTSVVLTLFLSNPTDAPLRTYARVESAPLHARLDAGELVAPPQGEASVTFTLRIDEDIPVGSEYVGLASTGLDAAGSAPFRVRVASAAVPPAPEPASLDARIVLALGAAAFGGGALLGAASWRRWPGFGFFALYARLAPRRALEHPRRRKMLDLLRASPGLTLAQLQRESCLSNGVARHHVALLEAAGVVRVVQDGALRRLWPVGVPIAPPTPGLAERAVATLVQRGPMRAAELADALGVSRQALHYHVKRLEREGRVVARREAKEWRLHVSEA